MSAALAANFGAQRGVVILNIPAELNRQKMSKTNDTPRGTAHWPVGDMTFAAAQLGQEFPKVPTKLITAAVDAAVLAVAPAQGRVFLMRSAREFLRPSV